MQLVDTHCHIHSEDYSLPVADVLERANSAGVTRLICVGMDAEDSERAVEFAQKHDNCWASIGLHPHDALKLEASRAKLRSLAPHSAPPSDKGELCSAGLDGSRRTAALSPPVLPSPYSSTVRSDPRSRLALHPSAEWEEPKVVAIGECGLDYFYNNSPKEVQEKALRFQIELALENNLPLIFHVREAFSDFWPIFDSYEGIKGVVHSFTDSRVQLDAALARGLLIGINGITTFTKNDWQLDNAKAVPLERLLLETDAPFLTPVPHRGKVNEPAHVRRIAEFLAELRNEPLEKIAEVTTANARQLFSI